MAPVLRDTLTNALSEVPAHLPPLEALSQAFRSAEQFLKTIRPFLKPRQKVISNTPAVQERELAKNAALIAYLAKVLERRGVQKRLAKLAAQVGMAAFSLAVDCCMENEAQTLGTQLDRAFEQLCTVTRNYKKR